MSEEWNHLVDRARARVGTTVNKKWTLDAVLGVGGMASVYAATHRNGKRGAVKILHPEVSLNTQVRSRFLREGYVANKVEHPGTVSVLDDDVADDGTAYLVMELLEGKALDVKHGSTPMTAFEALVTLDQVLAVLVAAHDKGIIHRDLKPANIFCTSDGTIKLLDFGIARLRDVSPGMPNPPTVSRHSMGTPGFMAPEQARGLWDEVDARTDLWALGATIFTAMTGKLVHDGRTVNEQLLAGMTKPAVSLASLLPEASPRVVEIVDRALAFERTDRWSSARVMRAAVARAYLADTGKPLPGSPPIDANVVEPELPTERAPERTSVPPFVDVQSATVPAAQAAFTGPPSHAATLPSNPPITGAEGEARSASLHVTTQGASSLSVPPKDRTRGRMPLVIAAALAGTGLLLFMLRSSSNVPAPPPAAVTMSADPVPPRAPEASLPMPATPKAEPSLEPSSHAVVVVVDASVPRVAPRPAAKPATKTNEPAPSVDTSPAATPAPPPISSAELFNRRR